MQGSGRGRRKKKGREIGGNQRPGFFRSWATFRVVPEDGSLGTSGSGKLSRTYFAKIQECPVDETSVGNTGVSNVQRHSRDWEEEQTITNLVNTKDST